MNTEINQKISRFLDGDLNPSEEEKLLLTISKDSELIDTLNRYQTVSHALKSKDFVNVSNGFLDKIKFQIDQEPHYLLPKQTVQKRKRALWKKASVAIAASTIIGAVLISGKVETLNKTIQPDVSFVAQQISEPELTIAEIPKDEVLIDEAQIELTSDLQEIQHERLKAYLEEHSDNLHTYDSLDIQPYARVVSQD